MSREFVTRNRRDMPVTTDLDEFVGGKKTDKVVRGYDVVDGKVVVHYKEATPVSIAPETGMYIGLRTIPASAKPISPLIVKKDTGPTPTVIEPEANKGWVDNEVDEVSLPVMPSRQETIEPASVKYIVSFDWAYGHGEVELDDIDQARAYPSFIQNYYKSFTFTNFTISKETRSVREEVSLETNQSVEE